MAQAQEFRVGDVVDARDLDPADSSLPEWGVIASCDPNEGVDVAWINGDSELDVRHVLPAAAMMLRVIMSVDQKNEQFGNQPSLDDPMRWH